MQAGLRGTSEAVKLNSHISSKRAFTPSPGALHPLYHHQGESFLFGKPVWNKRWFILNKAGKLRYYANESATREKVCGDRTSAKTLHQHPGQSTLKPVSSPSGWPWLCWLFSVCMRGACPGVL